MDNFTAFVAQDELKAQDHSDFNTLTSASPVSCERQMELALLHAIEDSGAASGSAADLHTLYDAAADWWQEHQPERTEKSVSRQPYDFDTLRAEAEQSDRKGILTAGGSGSRLGALTDSLNKHLLPVGGKPAIFYSLSSLLLTGVQEIAIVTTPESVDALKNLLGDGSRFGVELHHVVQDAPAGIADAVSRCEQFLESKDFVVALGDNVICGPDLDNSIISLQRSQSPASFLAVSSEEPFHFDVVTLDSEGQPASLELKPEVPKGDLVLGGLLFFEHQAALLAGDVQITRRGEKELYDVERHYFDAGQLSIVPAEPELTCIDMGRPETLYEAGSKVLAEDDREHPPGMPEVTARLLGNVTRDQLVQGCLSLPLGRYRTELEGWILRNTDCQPSDLYELVTT